MTREPGITGSGATTLLVLSGALVSALCLPGLCLRQSRAWIDEFAAETARADLMRDTFPTRDWTTNGGLERGSPVPPYPTPTATIDSPDGRFSMTVVDGNRVELVFPAGWSAGDLREVVANGAIDRPGTDTRNTESTNQVRRPGIENTPLTLTVTKRK